MTRRARSWAISPGGHSWELWSPRIDQMLELANDGFRHPLAAPHRRARRRARTPPRSR